MNALTDGPLLYPARPTIRVGGSSRPELSAGLYSMSVTETTAGLFACETVFGNWATHDGEIGFPYFDRSVFDFGKELTVETGEGNSAAKIFSGKITAIEGRFPQEMPVQVLVLAEDAFQALRMKRRSRTFEQITTQEVAEQLARDHGLTPAVDVERLSHPVLAQVNQSDLAFLRDLARSVDADLWIDGTTMHMQTRARRTGDALPLVYGKKLHEFAVTADLAHQRTEVRVSGWDVQAKETIDVPATDQVVRTELNGGDSGGSVLRAAFGARTDRLVHTVPLSRDEATAEANARYRRIARRFVTGRGVAEGDGRIRVGRRVDLTELGPLFNGQYTVVEAVHTFDPRFGYRTRFAVERAGLGRP